LVVFFIVLSSRPKTASVASIAFFLLAFAIWTPRVTVAQANQKNNCSAAELAARVAAAGSGAVLNKEYPSIGVLVRLGVDYGGQLYFRSDDYTAGVPCPWLWASGL
jgi:hypothetical protein